ncbi:MAG: hypothetical protein AAF449_12995 [Myxococcota bacterium]
MPKYRLQALLEIRERAEEEAKEELARAKQRVKQELDLLKEFEDELENMIQDRKRRREEYAQKLASGEMKITDQSAAYRFIDRLKEREAEQRGKIDAQREAVYEAEKAAQRAQDEYIAASQDLKALLKHKENWETKLRKERQIKEENNLDEIAQTMYQQRLRRGY